jgi:hypothetical protein
MILFLLIISVVLLLWCLVTVIFLSIKLMNTEARLINNQEQLNDALKDNNRLFYENEELERDVGLLNHHIHYFLYEAVPEAAKLTEQKFNKTDREVPK